MKAISIRPDYAFDILSGNKETEYRTWQTDHRGDLLICSTQKRIPGTIPGSALIVCSIDRIDKTDSGFAWRLGNPRTIQPFKVKGQQRIFNVDDSLIHFTRLEELPEKEQEEKTDEWITKSLIPLII